MKPFFNYMTSPGRDRKYHPGGGKLTTVPDMTLTVRELFNLYVQGRDVPQADGVYLEEDDVLNQFHPEYMDFEEKLEFAAALGEAVQDEYKARKRPKKQPGPAPAASPAPSDTIRDDIAGV